MCLYRPFDGTSTKDLANHVKRGKYAPVPSFYSSDLRRIVEACLAIEPTKRPTVVQILRLPYVVGHYLRLNLRNSEMPGDKDRDGAATGSSSSSSSS
jgi:serine/threonine protein kinase